MATPDRLPEATLRLDVKTLLLESQKNGAVKASEILRGLQERDNVKGFTDAALWRSMMAEANGAGISVEIDSLPPIGTATAG